jgi:phenylpropionate dioxygenase-like ring-hydroxylating dioxygenase large terminal subunit
LLFITLSAESLPFEEFFPGLEEMVQHVDFTKLKPRKCLRYEGKYNWKTMVDGYQECLHCPYAHPAFSKVYKPQIYYEVHNKHNYSQHIAQTNNPEDGLFIYLFPNTCLNIYGGGMSSFRVCPDSDPTKTNMEFDYYHMAEIDSEEFKSYYSFVRTVGIEDHDLCERAQENLNVGIYTEGLLNPTKENGVTCKLFLPEILS